MALSVKGIEKLKRQPGRYSDGHGLYLQVRSMANVSWLFRYERGGREHYMGLGPLHTFGLADARERARICRQQLADGIDPLDARRKAAGLGKTFEECATELFEGTEKRWTNEKHRQQFLSTLKAYVFPIIGNRPIATIGVPDILQVCEKKWPKHGGARFWDARPETAKRVLNRIEKVLAWATVRGLRTGDNPARWKGFLSTQLQPRNKAFAPVRHHAALPYGDLPAFMTDLHQRPAISARALEFTILTAARTGAVIGATWEEIDLEEKIWTVPSDRAGTKITGIKSRRVPLSPPAVNLLRSLPREDGNPHVFIGPKQGGGLSNAAMAATLERMGRHDITVHGFRSCFKDWVSERTSYPNHVSEAALWHAVADKVEAAYRRGDLFDKRRRLMADWARYCAGVANAEKAA